MEDFDDVSNATREQLIKLIKGGEAHATIEQAIADLPLRLRGAKPDGMPHTIWQLLVHIRIAQWDILRFCTNPNHISPKWPNEYWPKQDAPANDDAWEECIDQIYRDRAKFIELISDPETDLFKKMDIENGPTLFREALLIADHASYHIGQIILIRKYLDAWT